MDGTRTTARTSNRAHAATAAAPHTGLAALPYANRVQLVSVDDIWRWLARGWEDMMAAPVASITYGAIFVVIGFTLTLGLWWLDVLYLVTPLAAGFLIVAPLLAVGVYAMSRDLERGRRPGLLRALLAWRANGFHILTAGLILMLFMMIWVRLAALVFALFFPYTSMSLPAMIDALASIDGFTFLIVGTLIGGAMAAVAFVCSVVALPLMLEHRTDVFTAALVSALAVFANPCVMAVWAAVIVIFTGVGLISGFFGIAVILPWLGHATWHAYRDLVRWKE